MSKPLLALALFAACSTPAAAAESDPTTLLELAARRSQMIAWLHSYREAGVFPTDASGMPASVFKDRRGTRCPMAELLHNSGRDDLVDAVAREANTVRLADVHEGVLHAWMLSSGLTDHEIAMVQGVMTIELDRVPQEELTLLAAQVAVRAKLEIAEIALRDNTRHALEDAAKRLGEGDVAALAKMPVRGAVLPVAAVQAATRTQAAAETAALRARLRPHLRTSER